MAWDWLKKYMVGTQGQDLGIFGPNRSVAPTSGLFGTGGNFGKGGLLTTFNQPGTSGLYNMFANPYINIGAAMAAKGFQGKGVGESLFPSVKEGLSFTEGVEKIKSSKKKRELIKKYADKVPEEHKEEFLIAPERYIATKLTKEMKGSSLSKEGLELFMQGKNAGENFDKWFETLNKAEKDLYNKMVKPNINSMEAAFQFIEEREKALLSEAPALPLLPNNGGADMNKMVKGIPYNYNGQLVVFDGKELISYKDFMSKR